MHPRKRVVTERPVHSIVVAEARRKRADRWDSVLHQESKEFGQVSYPEAQIPL